jgi:hypothetical protein
MTVVVEDHTGTKNMHISSPAEAAYIAPDTWITLKEFSPGTILLVLCSGEYDPKEVVGTRQLFNENMSIRRRGERPPVYRKTTRSMEASVYERWTMLPFLATLGIFAYTALRR